MPYYDVYFEINEYKGEIKISEPEKCSELVWGNINNLPEAHLNTDMIKATTEYEKTVYECCCDLLGFDDFGITDDLTEIGLTFFKKLKLNTQPIALKNIVRRNEMEETIEVVLPDNAATRGMVQQVKHLVKVEEA